MEILLLILKIIGICLLVLIGILLFLVLSVIFIPVRYRISGKGEFPEKNELEADAVFSWFLHLIHCRIKYDSEGLLLKIRVFGIPLRLGRKNTPVRKKKEPASEKETDTAVSQEETTLPEGPESPGETHITEEAEISHKKKQHRKRHKKKKKKNKIKQAVQNLKDKLKNIKNQITNIKSIISEETNRNSLVFLLKELKYILKFYTPRKASGTLQYGMEDPANTGQVLGIISLFPFWYRYKISVTPDFSAEYFYVKGECSMRGHIRRDRKSVV